MPREIKSPITTQRGLNARMNALDRYFTHKGDRKGQSTTRMAAALGVSPVTLRRWKKGTQAPNLRKIEGLHNRLITLPKTRANLKNKTVPNSVKVTGIIVWNGYKNQAKNGHRSTTLGGMQGVMRRVIRLWASAGPDVAADVFQRGAADVENLPNTDDDPGFQVEGDDVDISFPWSD
jgi:hypothetical protein